MRSVLAVASELMMAMRLEALLQSVGCPVQMVNPDIMEIAAVAGEQPAVVVLDLMVPTDVRDAVFRLAANSGAALIAFGPHTDEARLRAAHQWGAAEVLPRSALGHSLTTLVIKHLTPSVAPQ